MAAEEPHSKTHTGEELFPCNQCSKASPNKGNLGAHTHTNPLQRRAVLLWLVTPEVWKVFSMANMEPFTLYVKSFSCDSNFAMQMQTHWRENQVVTRSNHCLSASLRV